MPIPEIPPALLSGPELANARKQAARSTMPTWRRVLMWRKKQRKPAHVGKKQLAKIAARQK